MKDQKFSISRRMDSFKYAFDGLRIMIYEEHNARIHFFVATCVIIAGCILGLSIIEWSLVIFLIGFVICLEVINTSMEHICDFISPDKSEKIRKIKDLSAAGVLIGATSAFIIGLIIFIPKIIKLL